MLNRSFSFASLRDLIHDYMYMGKIEVSRDFQNSIVKELDKFKLKRDWSHRF